MPILTAFAAEADALADLCGRIECGSRDPEVLFTAVDELRFELTALASRMRQGRPKPANDRGAWTGPTTVLVTGLNQVIVAPGRGHRR